MTLELKQAASILKALLKNVPDVEIGIDRLSFADRSKLTATCCAALIEQILLATANYDRRLALEGLDALAGDMRRNLSAPS
jgi:hypothetical protein